MELTAKFKQLLPIESGTTKDGKAWIKQPFLIEIPGQYPKTLCLSMSGDRIKYLESYKAGDEVTVKSDAESREYNGKWYTNCNAYYISHAVTEQPASEPEPTYTAQPIEPTNEVQPWQNPPAKTGQQDVLPF